MSSSSYTISALASSGDMPTRAIAAPSVLSLTAGVDPS